jgi:hypothetical protein
MGPDWRQALTVWRAAGSCPGFCRAAAHSLWWPAIPVHPLIFANDSFLSLAGYDRKGVLGQSFDFLMRAPTVLRH